MTLILNEIHIQNGLSDTFQIAAADRRITRENKIEPPRKKLFPIKHINSAVSYFGLAAFRKKGKEIYMSDWLPDFIKKSGQESSLELFANALREALNNEIPKSYRRKYHSGFHLCGYKNDGLPEFWYFSNISGMDGPYYKSPVENYAKPTADFLERDAIEKFKWDKINPKSAKNGIQIYRNGDIRTHAIVSEMVDNTMNEILKLPDFNRPKDIKEYAEYVKFKFEYISYIYKKWAQQKIIAKPIDTLILTKKGTLIKKRDKWQYIT